MTVDELRDEVARWTFMPGWRFEVRQLDDGFIRDIATLYVYSDVADAYHPDRTVTVVGSFPTPPLRYLESGDVGPWLRRCLTERMQHESDEWLRRDGRVPFDPHERWTWLTDRREV